MNAEMQNLSEDQVNNKYLSFTIGNELYATPLLDVREVIQFQVPKSMPNMIGHFIGIINLRGSIVGVVDLRKRFDQKAEVSQRTTLLVCDTGCGLLAAVVDKVEAVVNLEKESIESNPPVKSRVSQEFLVGIGKHKDSMITIVDLVKILSEDKLSTGGN